MAHTTLVTGGARSGKSALAERLTLRGGGRAIYIATAEAHDDEMRVRIAAHQARRGSEWTTHAEPLNLVDALRKTDTAPRLVDCLTLWLSNLLLADVDWASASDTLIEALVEQANPVVLVTNEVGAGIVPENALARAYRDAAGTLNQKVAAISHEVFLSVSGCPLKIKPFAPVK
ncbi:MAG: bifunctional adenosylcobinamide kinase/adenosylcobinamide-phosphate guanylyltransferase [Pseudomonadota bacterium]